MQVATYLPPQHHSGFKHQRDMNVYMDRTGRERVGDPQEMGRPFMRARATPLPNIQIPRENYEEFVKASRAARKHEDYADKVRNRVKGKLLLTAA
jgi:hypothetical protein